MPIIRLGSPSSSESPSSPDGVSSAPEAPSENDETPKTRRELPGNWLQAYAEYTRESESPESFHLWTGLSILASAVRRNVFLNQGIYHLFPNLYVVLTAPPGKVAKSTTIRLGRSLLYGVPQIKFGPDSVTVEELIRQLDKAGANSISAALTLHSTELSDLIDPSGVKMVSFLTSIYDGDVKWNRGTKGSGHDNINKPVVNLLGGTTPGWISNGMPVQAVDHGFTSRTIFVYEDAPRFDNPYPNEPDRALVRSLINDLNHIALLKGEFQWEEGKDTQPIDSEGHPSWTPSYEGSSNFRPSARSVYAYYYRRIRNTRVADYRLEGYYSRKRNHLLKVAMLLSLAESDELLIRRRDLDTAWKILDGTEKRMARTFSAVGKYEHASDLERILGTIQETGGITEQEIYEENYAAGDVHAIERILQMLIQMKRVKRVKEGSDTWLRPVRR